MLTALLFLPLLPQQPAAGLDEVRLAEGRRVATIEGCAPAVCSVMDMKAPGGGSGVIFDPRGFVLTNYHVVGEPDASQPETPAPRLPFPLPGFGQDDGEEIEEPTIPSPDEEQLRAFRQADPARSALDDTALRDAYQAWWQAEFLPRGESHYRHKKVGLPDGELYEAVVLGIDPGSDLAVLRLLPKYEGQRWPWCRLGDSDALLVGETVFAMGNPFLLATDFTPTVTFGIVSGTHRYQEGQGNRMLVYPDCIQVDAPVNPGNSGGPLFNERGEVVGINGRISIGDRGRVNVGVGFAIASNQVRNFLGELMAGRHAEHGTLDMSAWYMNAPGDADMRRGVFVQQIYKDSVVARAGVSLGDELTMFNGQRIRSANQLAHALGKLGDVGASTVVGGRRLRRRTDRDHRDGSAGHGIEFVRCGRRGAPGQPPRPSYRYAGIARQILGCRARGRGGRRHLLAGSRRPAIAHPPQWRQAAYRPGQPAARAIGRRFVLLCRGRHVW